MWRKLDWLNNAIETNGNTSTYVEKTAPLQYWGRIQEKHLHVCGENAISDPAIELIMETPPRMWRKPKIPRVNVRRSGNTSTYVEKTLGIKTASDFLRKHLHVCGENLVSGQFA